MNDSNERIAISTVNVLQTRSIEPQRSHHFYIAEDLILSNLGESVPHENLEHWLMSLYQQQREVTLYVHIPWCIEKCSFCYYRSSDAVPRTEMDGYLNLLANHFAIASELFELQNKVIPSVYFGGGTPSILPPDLLERALNVFSKNFRSKDTEVTVEASVNTLSEEKIRVISNHANRLSLGIQSFNDRLLKKLRRTHSGASASKMITRLLRNFDHLNIDLIYGMSDQSLDDWTEDIRHAISLGTPSITIYRLEIRSNLTEGANYLKHPDSYPSDDETVLMYMAAKQILMESGYRETLTGWFLLRSEHDVIVYRKRWEEGVPCIAFGPGTHNYGSDHFYYNDSKLQSYASSVNNRTLPIGNSYSYPPDTVFLWHVIACWRSNSPVDIGLFKEVHEEKRVNWLLAWVTNKMDSKYFVLEGGKLGLTTLGNSIIDQILASLIQVVPMQV